MKCDDLSSDELRRAVAHVREVIERSRVYLDYLAAGEGLPRGPEARGQLIESLRKITDHQEEYAQVMEQELQRRAL
jgi:hypothetical protein